MHDTGHPLYLPLRLLHILGAMLFLGALVAAVYWKVSADRSGDPSYVARVHQRIRRADKHLVGTGALLTFAAGYAMVRFLGGRIAQHGFVLWGLVVMFLALALWYFGVRRVGEELSKEADAAFLRREPLGRAFASRSVAWLAMAFLSVSLVVVVAIMMVFRIPSG